MSALLIVALIAVVAKLWHQVDLLSRRVGELELAGYSWAPKPLWQEPPAPAFEPSDEQPPISIDGGGFAGPTVGSGDGEAPAAWVSDPAVADAEPSGPVDTLHRPFGFEDLFGRRLPIWAGGLTLAIAGLLIVRYSIEAGLLSPVVRVVAALLFGGGLIAGGEVALRGKVAAVDPRVPQALAGAGVASLYGAVLAAVNLYGLVGPATAFAGLAGITLLAGLLSLRFGSPSAVLGLIGGLAAPALVGAASPSIPLLAAYLGLATTGLCTLARSRGWWWLGAGAIAGGFGWSVALLASGTGDAADTLSVGGLILLAALALPLLLVGGEARLMRIVAGLAGAGQLAALVATGGFAMLDWGLYGLLTGASVWLARRDEALAALPGVALGIGLALMVAWPTPDAAHLAIVIGGATAVLGGSALVRLWREDGRLGDAAQIAALSLAIGILPVWHFMTADPRLLALPSLLGAGLAGAAAAVGWRSGARHADARFAILVVSAGLLLVIAAILAVPVWAVPPSIALIALALLLISRTGDDARVGIAAAVFGGTATLIASASSAGLSHAFGASVDGDWQGLVRWGVPALVAGAFGWRAARPVDRAGQALAVLLGYGALAQVVPAGLLPLLAAAMLAVLAMGDRRSLQPAMAAAATIVLAWAMPPLGEWLADGVEAIGGRPLYSTALPSFVDAIRQIAVPAAVMALVGRRGALDRVWRHAASAAAAVLGTVTIHIAFKHLFGIHDLAGFVARDMAERTLWEMLLGAAAWLAWHRGARRLAVAFGVASLLHFGWFTLLLHDPFWAVQQVGPWLVPAFGTALALVASSVRTWPAGERFRACTAMTLTVLFAYLILRQASSATMLLAAGTAPGEDIARSVLAVLLSIAFLRWGIARGGRDWRIGSLVLMIAAVAKVFLRDAAGLDGLARIASFAALGFSLIGVGWLYSRYLPDRQVAR